VNKAARLQQDLHYPFAMRLSVEICILAGGLSKRMGREKAQLKLGGRTMLGRVRAVSKQTRLETRVIRRDSVPRCGPVGGVFTALNTSTANAVLFLACDMPFVTVELLNFVIAAFTKHPADAVFTNLNGRLGFPFLLPRSATETVRNHIEAGNFSLQILARALKARRLRVPRQWKACLQNINTPEELKQAKGVGVRKR
jgi:molybdopterin-guanine dinucleotide biosynthesis protein A